MDDLTADGAFEPQFLTRGAQRTPEIQTVQNAVLEVVMDVMQNELSERQRKALYARLVLGTPIDILAEQMDTNPNALYKLIHDARKRLKHRLIERGLSPQEALATFKD